MVERNITIFTGKSKEGKEYKAVKIQIGKWDALYFPKTKFEMDYIEESLTQVPSSSVEAETAKAKEHDFLGGDN